jgi:hypothetical protein
MSMVRGTHSCGFPSSPLQVTPCKASSTRVLDVLFGMDTQECSWWVKQHCHQLLLVLPNSYQMFFCGGFELQPPILPIPTLHQPRHMSCCLFVFSHVCELSVCSQHNYHLASSPANSCPWYISFLGLVVFSHWLRQFPFSLDKNYHMLMINPAIILWAASSSLWLFKCVYDIFWHMEENINTVIPPYPRDLHPWTRPTTNRNYLEKIQAAVLSFCHYSLNSAV